MRGILIDPFTRTVSYVETSAGLLDMYDLLQVDCITVLRVDQGNAMILDDEGLLKSKDIQAYFTLGKGNQPFAGRGLILGDKYGESKDVTIPIEAVESSIVWLDNDDVDPDAWTGWKITVF